MDDLYDNLDNYNEESTIAELREENKELKFKLEEYASTLDKLQKEFDILASEHKQLELNYSSLLKTARSEIERKTQIITKLNIEKDAMVLSSIQNRSLRHFGRKSQNINNKDDCGLGKQSLNSCDNNRKASPNPVLNERAGGNILPPENLNAPGFDTNTPYRNIQTRLLDLVNKSISNPNPRTDYEIKENIRLDNDSNRSRARISSRRKSMPVSSMACAKFSTDEEDETSCGSTKEPSRGPERRNLDRFSNEKPNTEGHFKSSKETRNRLSRYDSDNFRSIENNYGSQWHRRNQSPNRRNMSPEKGRGSPKRRVSQDRKRDSPTKRGSSDRKRGSPDRRRNNSDRRRISPDKRRVSPDRRRLSSDKKRFSPDRNQKNIEQKSSRDHSEEFYRRQEYDKRRRLISPSTDKYYVYDYTLGGQKTQRLHERNRSQDFDKYKSSSQDIYSLKHKMSNDYEEPSKRMRLDSQPHHEERRRAAEPDFAYLHNMSCQSPEYTHIEAQPSHQIREIKLHSTTKLDDPRISSTKYTMRTHRGKPEFCTTDSANVDMKVLDTSGWDMIRTMKMPDALLKAPETNVLPTAVLLQKPMVTVTENVLEKQSTSSHLPQIHKPSSPDMPHAEKTQASNLPHAPQKPSSIDKPFASIQQQKSAEMPDNVTQKAISIDTPDIILAQKPKPKDDSMLGTRDQISTDEILPDTIPHLASTDEISDEVHMHIQDPTSNVSMESGEIYDYDDVESHSSQKNTNGKIKKGIQDEPRKSESSSNYKIPKKDKSDSQVAEINKDKVSELKHNLSAKINDKKMGESSKKKNDSSPTQNKKKIPQRRKSEFQCEFQNYIATKEIIGDFELSDDEISDNADVQIHQHTLTVSKPKQVSPGTSDTKLCESKSKELNKNQIHDEPNLEDKLVKDKKPKSKKKSLQLKETKIPLEVNKNAFINKPVKSIETPIIEQSGNKDEKDKEASLSIDQLDKIKENLIKELEKKDTAPSRGRPVKKKEASSSISPENIDSAPLKEKPVKKKETKKDPLEIKDTPVLPLKNKPVKKKESKKEPLQIKDNSVLVAEQAKQKVNIQEPIADKQTETLAKPVKKKEAKIKDSTETKNTKPSKKQQSKLKQSSETTEHAASTIVKLDKNKINKTKETKFSELFGDSSSLVSPEDLGLIPAVEPQENYVPIFEDAQDAIDVAKFTTPVSSASIEETRDTISKADAKSKIRMNIESLDNPVVTAGQIQTSQESVAKEILQAEHIPVQSMYQNLQSDILSKENDIVKTIIISSGIQAPLASEAVKTNTFVSDTSKDLHVMQCVKPTVLQGMAMQALATSTPQKVWQQNVTDPTPNSRCTNESVDNSVEKTPTIDNSDNNTNTSQTNDPDEPDMKIFVKRRRKVLKKK